MEEQRNARIRRQSSDQLLQPADKVDHVQCLTDSQQFIVRLHHTDTHALIWCFSFANKLNVPDEAAGVIKYVESRQQQTRQMNVQPKGEWYEPLNQWEKALAVYSKVDRI